MGLDERADRILTTHVGSLPRPDALSAMMADGKTATQAFDTAVRDAVDAVVRRQAEAGIDIVDDGEQSKPGFVAYVLDRVGGFSPRDDMPDGFLKTRENQAFPEFYSCGHSGAALAAGGDDGCDRIHRAEAAARRHREPEGGAEKREGRRRVHAGRLTGQHRSLAGQSLLHRPTRSAFTPSPRRCARNTRRSWRPGFMLQIDDPRLVMHYMLHPQMSIEDARRWIGSRIAALNHALRNIPPERIRHHTCYGINMGPRTNDLEFRHVVDLVLTIRANFYSFEAANPRHEHEWRVWENVKLPAGKAILPGVITQSSVVVEHPELVAERIGRFASLVGRENVIASADCGFASTPRTVPEVHPTIVWEKFRSLVEGARIATRALWARSNATSR